MTLDWAFVSHSALASQDGQIHALAIGVDTFAMPSLPGSVQQPAPTAITITCVVRLLATASETGTGHSAMIQIVDGARVALLNNMVPFTVNAPSATTPVEWPHPVQIITPMMFAPPQFAHYAVLISLDNALLKAIPFRVVSLSPSR